LSQEYLSSSCLFSTIASSLLMTCGNLVGVLRTFIFWCLSITVRSVRDEAFGQASFASSAGVSLTGAELRVERAYQPQEYSIDELALTPGDRVQVTHDPWKADMSSEHYVFGVNMHSGHSGWFPASHAVVNHGGTSLLQPGGGVPCKNSLFSDWGSSGMKVFHVHIGDAIGEVRNVKADKKKELIGTVDEDNFESSVTELCNKLKAAGDTAEHTWRIYATAGLRLHVGHAKELWNRLRQKVTSKPECAGLFAECDNTTNKGCKTLSGGAEAIFEMSSYFMDRLEEPGLEKMLGWVGAGGASLQLGFFGAPPPRMRTCIAKLNGVWADDTLLGAPTYDEMPGMVAYQGDTYVPSLGQAGGISGRLPNGMNVFLFSFLAVGGDTKTCSKKGCDHLVGGINEMRKRFEEFLLVKKKTHNPCLEASEPDGWAPFPLKYGNDFFSSQLKGGLKGLRESSGLSKDKELHMKNACISAVDEFISYDKSIQAWKAGKCDELVRPIDKWGFMTSFTRDVGMLFDVDYARDMCNEATGEKPYACGKLLTNTLLSRFLHVIGFDITDTIEVDELADWARAPMKLYGLKEGWCPEPAGTSLQPTSS